MTSRALVATAVVLMSKSSSAFVIPLPSTATAIASQKLNDTDEMCIANVAEL